MIFSLLSYFIFITLPHNRGIMMVVLRTRTKYRCFFSFCFCITTFLRPFLRLSYLHSYCLLSVQVVSAHTAREKLVSRLRDTHWIYFSSKVEVLSRLICTTRLSHRFAILQLSHLSHHLSAGICHIIYQLALPQRFYNRRGFAISIHWDFNRPLSLSDGDRRN